MIGSIQHSLVAEIMATSTSAVLTSSATLILGSIISSNLISQGTSLVIDDANVARELACLFYTRPTWATFAVQNLFMIYFTACEYAFILES